MVHQPEIRIPTGSRLVTRFKRLSRRISLAGLLSNHQATEAIAQGTLDEFGEVLTWREKWGFPKMGVPQNGDFMGLNGMNQSKDIINGLVLLGKSTGNHRFFHQLNRGVFL